MRKRKWVRIGMMWVALDAAEKHMTPEQRLSYQRMRKQIRGDK